MEQMDCLYKDKTCNHTMHIDSKNENNISALSKGINSLIDMTSIYFNKLYTKASKIEEKVDNTGEVTDLDLNNKSKELLSDVNYKLDQVINNNNIESDLDLGPLYYSNSNVILALSDEDESSDESSTYHNIKKEKQKREKVKKQEKYDFDSYKTLSPFSNFF